MIADLAQRAARTRRRRSGAALAVTALGIVALFSCERSGDRRAAEEAMPLSHRFSPTRTIELRAGSNDILEPQFLLQATPNELIAIEKGTQDLWELPLDPRRKSRRVGPLRGRGRTRIIGAAGGEGRFALLDLAGNLWFYRSGDAEARDHQHVAAPQGTGAIALLATGDSTWLIAQQHTSVHPSDHSMRDSALVVAVESTGIQRPVWGIERAGPSHPHSFFSDFVAAGSFGDTVVVTAADPPRIVMWRGLESSSRRETMLAKSPQRRMTSSDRAALVSAAGSTRAPLAGNAILRPYYPPIAGARPDGQGWFVVAGAGSRNFALDYYCRGSFEETLLEDPAITKISLFRDGLAVVREDLDRDRVLVEYYTYATFARSCR